MLRQYGYSEFELQRLDALVFTYHYASISSVFLPSVTISSLVPPGFPCL